LEAIISNCYHYELNTSSSHCLINAPTMSSFSSLSNHSLDNEFGFFPKSNYLILLQATSNPQLSPKDVHTIHSELQYFNDCIDANLSDSASELCQLKSNLTNLINFQSKLLNKLNSSAYDEDGEENLSYQATIIALKGMQSIVRKLSNPLYSSVNRDCLLVLSSLLRNFLPTLLELIQSDINHKQRGDESSDAQSIEQECSRLFCAFVSCCPVSAW
jgi:hypothetical protein